MSSTIHLSTYIDNDGGGIDAENDLLRQSIQKSTYCNFMGASQLVDWLESHEERHRTQVTNVPLNQLRQWHISETTGFLEHESSRFFSIVGCKVHNIEQGGITKIHTAPMILQQDVGILGLLATIVDGLLVFLVQAKIEPGNKPLAHVSPTVQATSSNLDRVHDGKDIPYLQWFLTADSYGHDGHYLHDSLQTEHGEVFLGKKNRNAIKFINPQDFPPIDEDFRLVSIKDLHDLALITSRLHADTRSILGAWLLSATRCFTLPNSQPNSVRKQYVETIPLSSLKAWTIQDGVLRGASDNALEVAGVSVHATSREISSWDQPLVRFSTIFLHLLVVRKSPGGFEILVSKRQSPGISENLELGPSYTASGNRKPMDALATLFAQSGGTSMIDCKPEVLFDNLLPEEGGRFFHQLTRHTVILLPKSKSPLAPHRSEWIPLRTLRTFGHMGLVLNMELRSLLACLPPQLIIGDN